MEKVFTGRDGLETHFVRNLMESQGIQAKVLGEMLGVARGTLPLIEETLPSVWVRSEDVQQAKAIVDEFVQSSHKVHHGPSESESWTCPNCGEIIEGQFSMCWNCQTLRSE